MTDDLGFGIDIGGSGIKGAPVDLTTGRLVDERYRVETPQPSTPDAVAAAVSDVLNHFNWTAPFGCTFPAVVQHGVVRTAANVSKEWVDTDIEQVLGDAAGRPVAALNDADAAGIAETHFGAATGQDGLVIVTTLGTGIGSALILGGRLVPNTELGHLVVDGEDAEIRASANARKGEDLSWKDWAKRLSRYYTYVESLLWPDLFVAGGGVSKKSDKWLDHVQCRTPIVAAQLQNEAGIIGAAMVASERHTG
ncbi:MAG: ROK family protein [Propionibacteriales bacterium]|nr:ROK family protein [Propionibacteriales bacterium]